MLFPCPAFNVTSQAQLNIQGPRSREVLQALTDTDMSNETFPFRMCKEISIGYARVRCGRITYLGELGQVERSVCVCVCGVSLGDGSWWASERVSERVSE